MKYPLKKYVGDCDWVILENNWGKIFEELKIDPTQHYIIILEEELLIYPKEVKEKMARIMFETFQVKGLYFLKEPIYKWNIINYGYHNYCEFGIVIDLGDYSTNITPIFDDFILPHACIKCDFGGKELDKYKVELLSLKCIDSIRKCDYEFEDKKKILIVLSVENSNNIYSNISERIKDEIFKEFHSSAICRLFQEDEVPRYFYCCYSYQDFMTLTEWEEWGYTMLHRKFF